MYTLSQTDLETITDEETIRGTQRLLPKPEDIPDEFWGWFKGFDRNVYFRIAEAMYVGETPPAGAVSFNPGFTGAGMSRCLKAHLVCIEVEYQHRMAGLAYMISCIVTITPEKS